MEQIIENPEELAKVLDVLIQPFGLIIVHYAVLSRTLDCTLKCALDLSAFKGKHRSFPKREDEKIKEILKLVKNLKEISDFREEMKSVMSEYCKIKNIRDVIAHGILIGCNEKALTFVNSEGTEGDTFPSFASKAIPITRVIEVSNACQETSNKLTSLMLLISGRVDQEMSR